MNDQWKASEADTTQYLTFLIAGEVFAINILATREVLRAGRITSIPDTPEYMAGVINLRGTVVPVLDLRKKFRLAGSGNPQAESIIIIEVMVNGELVVAGALVDSVQSVLRFEKQAIESPPKIGMKLEATFIEALARRDDRFVIMLNVNRIFAAEDLSAPGGMRPESERNLLPVSHA